VACGRKTYFAYIKKLKAMPVSVPRPMAIEGI
jgi:hypothetical protein